MAYFSESNADLLDYYRILKSKQLQINRLFMALHDHTISPYWRKRCIDMIIVMYNKISGIYKIDINYDTLFYAINYFDKFMSSIRINNSHTMYITIAVLWIAIKYDECVIPTASEMISLSGHKLSCDSLLNIEQVVLNVLDFKISAPTCYTFCRYVLYVLKANSIDMKITANILIASIYSDVDYYTYTPCTLGIGAACLACYNSSHIRVSTLQLSQVINQLLDLSNDNIRRNLLDCMLYLMKCYNHLLLLPCI